MTTIAILGLGAMGSRMAKALLDAGHEVTVYNRTPDPAKALELEGAKRAASPRQAAEGAAVVLSMVTDDEASRAVWCAPETGALAGLEPNAVAIETSTLTPGWIARLGEAVAGRGAGFLDAPVAGSRPQAEAGALVFLVGGEAGTLDRVRDLLGAMASAILHAGPCGAGTAMKLAVNAIFGIQVAALGEVLGLLAKLGIDKGRAAEMLSEMPVTSRALKGIAGLIASDNHAPLFPIDLVEKDFGYVLAAARQAGAETPTTAAVRRIYETARQEGLGGKNISGVARLFD